MHARLLFVDDHASFRAFARRLLSVDGFDVIGEVTDRAGALSATRELCPDVAPLDVQLPDVEGFSGAEALTARPGAPAVVVVSGRAGADYVVRVSRSARGFVAKADPSGDTLRPVLCDEERNERSSRPPALVAGSTADLERTRSGQSWSRRRCRCPWGTRPTPQPSSSQVPTWRRPDRERSTEPGIREGGSDDQQ